MDKVACAPRAGARMTRRAQLLEESLASIERVEALDDETLRAELEWWERVLEGAPKTSTLPVDKPRTQTPSGVTHAFRFNRELSAGIRNLVREERATAYMAMVSACAIVLRWYTGQDDIVVGSPLGPFVNLALRLDLSGNPTFAELLSRARGAVLDAHDHRQVPFEKLLDHLKPERSVEHSPIFQVALVLQNGAAEGVSIDGGGAPFDLTWFAHEADGEFVGGLEYRSDIYSPDTIEELAAQLATVLGRAVANRRLRLSELLVQDASGDSHPPTLVGASSMRTASDAPPVSRRDELAYFRGKLAGASSLQLPSDRPRRSMSPRRRASVPVDVSWAILGALERVASTEQATPQVVLLSAFEVLLYRHSGQSDVTLGAVTPAEGLQQARFTTLPLRVRVDPEASFLDLVRQVRAASVEAASHQLSAERLDALGADAGGLGELLSVLFSYATEAVPGIDGAAARSALADHTELGLYLTGSPGGACGSFEYDAELFDEATIRRLCGHFLTIVEAVAASPKLHVSRIPLLTREERERLDALTRRSMPDAPPATPVIELFETRARLTPDAPAIVGPTTLTYQELDAAANALAHRLLLAGAEPGQRVAVSLHRSPAVVIALLAVLKARAAYVPLDPHYPPERSGYVIDDAEPVVLVTEESVLARLPVPPSVTTVCVDPTAVTEARADPPKGAGADPDSIAYVIYTSGSTGRPKGVEIPNRALTNFLSSMQHTPGLTVDDLLLSVTTISFDIAGLEIFLPLVTGARLQIVPRDVVVDGGRLAALIERSGATVMQATPATWRLLIEAGWRGDGRLKILSGGEAMSRQLADQLLARVGSVWNMYGPTETTIWSTAHRVSAGEGPVPIGKPIDNTPIHVLDPHGERVPLGVLGEIFIGGAGVARGYLKRPELTAQRFLPDPFVGGGARMYRTGDAGRLKPDGSLDYVGRLDDQVKIRGHRIELGEIEAVLREHPAVAAAVVVAREFAPGDTRLVGYFVERSGNVTLRDLRELCQRRLPIEMVPTWWVRLRSIPLTPNGKTDKNALPPPTDASIESTVERVPPRDALEAELTRIWESVLEVKITSVKDSFFDLGGHSLLATRIFARVEQSTGVSLPLATLIEGPTIEYLAERIRERQRPAHSKIEAPRAFTHLVPIQPRGTHPPLYCVHGAGGNVLNLHDLVRYLPADRPFYGIQAAGVDGATRPMDTIEEMAAQYLLEVRALQPHGPYYLSGYCGGGMVAYEMAQRLQAAGEDVALLALIDLYRPGVFEPSSRRERWGRTLREGNLPSLLHKAKRKMERDAAYTARQLLVRYHLARGHTIPYDLRDFWLTGCFLEAVERYRLRPYAGRLTVFRAREANPARGELDPDLGWAGLAREGVAAYEVPGDHHTLTREPNVQVLAAHIESCLRGSVNGAPPTSVRVPPRL
jgi:amino acid adenylation domain-containing protein